MDHYFAYVAHTSLKNSKDMVGLQVLERRQNFTLLSERFPMADQVSAWRACDFPCILISWHTGGALVPWANETMDCISLSRLGLAKPL